MKKNEQYKDTFCESVNKAIKVSKEYMNSVDKKMGFIAMTLPAYCGKPKISKWGRICISANVCKDLKRLKKVYVKLMLNRKDAFNDRLAKKEMDIACQQFAISFKEQIKAIIESKVSGEKEDRAVWDELLEMLDLLGYQIVNEAECFSTLSRYVSNKKKQKQSQNIESMIMMQNQIRAQAKLDEELKKEKNNKKQRLKKKVDEMEK